jgi:branched-subunit amino acid aminotransferase/4-amino-4-deoxychorismate lyase
MQVWLNGQFIDRDSATVSIFDAGFQHAVGLFETMLARNGRVFRVETHMRRIAESASDLLLTKQLDTEALCEAVQLVVDHHELSEARIRLTITGGNLNTLQATGRGPQDPTILIVAQPPTRYPDEYFDHGTTTVVADARANPLDPMAGHKTLNYWTRIQALQLAGMKKASEAIWFTVSNHLASGSVSNVVLVKDGALLTPIARGEEEAGAMKAPVLPGVTRDAILQLARADGLAITKKMLDINDLLDADEVFLTNSSWGVLPIIALEKEQIGTGKVGELTMHLRRQWLDLVEEETSAAVG